jgi:hypothetical protein
VINECEYDGHEIVRGGFIDRIGAAGEFVELKDNPFGQAQAADAMPWIKRVEGSKPGVFYTVNTEEMTCTCQGYTFRGACKHIKQLETV